MVPIWLLAVVSGISMILLVSFVVLVKAYRDMSDWGIQQEASLRELFDLVDDLQAKLRDLINVHHADISSNHEEIERQKRCNAVALGRLNNKVVEFPDKEPQ